MKKISFIFFYIIIVFLPLTAVLGNILEFKTAISSSQIFWMMHWYEIVLPFVLIYSLYSAVKNKKIIDHTFLLAILIIVYSVVLVVVSADRGRSLEGFRFVVLPVLFFTAARINFSLQEKLTLKKTYITMSVAIACLAIVERFFPIKYWNNWNIISPDTVFGWGWHHAASFSQSASVFGGPNQLASYLLPALFLLMVGIKNQKSVRFIIWHCIGVLVILLTVFFTVSRSVWIGLAFASTIYFLFYTKKYWVKLTSLAVLILLISAAVFAYKSNITFNSILTHGGQTGHIESLKISLSEIVQRNWGERVIGAGLGTAGPLSIKYGNGIISESWYLQLVLEIGILGLFFYLALIISLLYNLHRRGETGLVLGLLSVSITTIFLHTFADNPALAYTLFILIALPLNNGRNHGKNTN